MVIYPTADRHIHAKDFFAEIQKKIKLNEQ
jgi:hypothetical protein